MLRAALAIVTLVFFAPPVLAQRLPATVVPVHYTLEFAPDLQQATFTGRETIQVVVKQPTAAIVMNAAELRISRAVVHRHGESTPARVSFDETLQQVTLTLPSAAPAGNAEIELEFAGTLNTRLRGFYISRSPRRAYAATQFESTDARRAFPCFDEPAFKATFDISLTVPAGDMAISNAPVLRDEPSGSTHTVTFKTTARMSSYLVAFAVGDFKCTEGTAGNVPLRVCAIPEKVELTRFGLAAAQRIVPFFSDFYGIPYPFEKLDVVALPDFAAGAMENTGAIFYREAELLVDENNSSTQTLKFVANVLSHEIAHQWFGDLVTMRWWDDVWLNEGFATWAANKPLEGWRGWSFAESEAAERLSAMSADQLPSTRGIYLYSDDPGVIEESFDTNITYNKSATVLRMVEHYLGADVFRRGVSAYLKKFSYANATSTDFWTTLATVSGKPADRVMKSFVMQPGVPQIDIEPACAGGQTRLTLRQHRFLLAAPTVSRGTMTWSVPVCLARPSGPGTCLVLEKPVQTATLPGCAPWLFGNADGAGYYRTKYAGPALEAVRRQAFPTLSPIDRNALVADQWAFTRTGDGTLGDFLSLAGSALRTPDQAVVNTIAEALEFVDDYLIAPPERPAWQQWVDVRVRPLFDRFGWDPKETEPAGDREMRRQVIDLLGTAVNDPTIQAEAIERVKADLAGSQALPPSIATAAYTIAARAGDATLYDAIKQSISPDLPPVQYYRRQNALASFLDPALVRRTFEYALSPDVRNQDAPLLLAGLAGEPRNTPVVWPLMKQRWAEVEKKTAISAGAAIVIRSLSFCSQPERDDVAAFFAAHRVPGTEQALKRGLERIDACIVTKNAQQGAVQQAVQ